MASADINSLLVAHAKLLSRVEAKVDADIIKLLVDKLAPKKSLLAVVDKSLQNMSKSGGNPDKTTQRALLLVNDLTSVLKTAAKKDVLADLGRLALFLERHRSMPLATLLAKATHPPERPDEKEKNALIADYIQRLEKARGREGFENLLENIARDRRIKKAGLVKIANALGEEDISARSSIASIKSRLLDSHNNLVGFRLKKKAMAGRSAA